MNVIWKAVVMTLNDIMKNVKEIGVGFRFILGYSWIIFSLVYLVAYVVVHLFGKGFFILFPTDNVAMAKVFETGIFCVILLFWISFAVYDFYCSVKKHKKEIESYWSR